MTDVIFINAPEWNWAATDKLFLWSYTVSTKAGRIDVTVICAEKSSSLLFWI